MQIMPRATLSSRLAKLMNMCSRVLESPKENGANERITLSTSEQLNERSTAGSKALSEAEIALKEKRETHYTTKCARKRGLGLPVHASQGSGCEWKRKVRVGGAKRDPVAL